MNTVKSFWLGWGSLCVAGAGAYYFAKKDINAGRQAKLEEQRRRKHQQQQSAAYYESASGSSDPAPTAKESPVVHDTAGSPSQEGNQDPAPTRHEPTTEQQRIEEKSKYESGTPYRSRKGDRFS